MTPAHATKVILVGGGARSGKSAFALALARHLGERRAFVATAQALDAEMRARITRHRAERGADFRTIEAPLDLPEAMEGLDGVDVVVVDCLTLWLSNLLLAGAEPGAVLDRVGALASDFGRGFHVVLVTNEVGMGIVPESALGRAFRDLAGHVHQRLARSADEIYLATLGVVLRVHPGPVERVQTAEVA